MKKHAQGDFVYSPLGISVLLGITDLATVAATKKEIIQRVGFPESDLTLLNGFKSLINFCSVLTLKMDKHARTV